MSTLSSRYLNGVKEFLNFALAFLSEEDTIRCPCVECNDVYFKTREEVQFDLVSMRKVQSYTQCVGSLRIVLEGVNSKLKDF